MKHELRVNSLLQTMGWWKFVIMVALLFAAFLYVSISTVMDRITVEHISDLSLGFGFLSPLLMVGMYYHQMKNEWLANTHVWWLTLPYSRFLLVFTKLLAGFIQLLKIILVFYAITLLLAVYASIQGSTFALLGQHVRIMIVSISVVLFFYPALAAYMMLLATISKSKYKPLLPFLWAIFFPALIAALQGFMAPIFSAGMRIGRELVVDTPWYTHFQISFFWYTVLISWAISLVIIVVNAYLLKRKLEL